MNNIPTLHEVSQLIEDNGLAGEEDTALVVLLSTIMGGFVIMRGKARTGKDEVVDCVVQCYPNKGEEELFRVPNSTSPTVLFEKAGQANNASIHIYPDPTSLEEHIEALLKAHAEGREYTHEWTEVSGGRHLEGRTLFAPDCQIMPVATDNQSFDLNDHPEFKYRSLPVWVDGSKAQTKRVNTRQAMDESGLYVDNLSPEEKEAIRQHVGSIRGVVDRFGRKDSMGTMLNPSVMAMDSFSPLPQHFPEARQDFPRLFKVCRSVALYHHTDRIQTVDSEGNPVMLVTPADCWIAMRIFGERMIMSALNLEAIDKKILNTLRASGQGYSVSELQQEIRAKGENITDADVRDSLKNMKFKGYVKKDKGKSGVNEWAAGPFAPQVEHTAEIDWAALVEQTKEDVKARLTDEDAAEYVARFCEGEGLLVTDPFTGETVNITEDDGMQGRLDDAEESLTEEVFDEPVFGGKQKEEDEEPEAPTPEVGAGTLGKFQ